MKFLLMSAALVAVVMAEAPSAPEGWRPSGRLLLLPARLEYPLEAEQGTSTTTQPPTNATQSDESQSEKLLDSGEYYVLLPDGRLQMVKYTTAALREAEEAASNSQQAAAPAQQQQAFQYRSPFPADSSNFQRQQLKPVAAPAPAPAPALPEPFARFQIEYLQFPQPQYVQQPAENKPEEPKSSQNKAEEKEEVSGFEANVQYRDVKPISAPVYAYNPTPLVRILKK